MNEVWSGIVSVLLALVGIGALAVIVSRNANTMGVINAATGGFSTALGVAESPVTGAGGSGFGYANMGATGINPSSMAYGG